MKEIKCNKCDHAWKTRSKMKYVSCPSCLSKVRIEEDTKKDVKE